MVTSSFLSCVRGLAIPTDTLPDDQFVDASVVSDDPSWERRSYAQLQKHPNAPILAQSPDLPKWLQFKNNYNVWQRNNLWLLSQALCKGAQHFTPVGLWDGELAKESGARVVHLNTKEIFGLTDLT